VTLLKNHKIIENIRIFFAKISNLFALNVKKTRSFLFLWFTWFSVCQPLSDAFNHFWRNSSLRPSWDFAVVTFWASDQDSLLVQVSEENIDDGLVDLVAEFQVGVDSDSHNVTDVVVGIETGPATAAATKARRTTAANFIFSVGKSNQTEDSLS
jgi:hypothetical protein